MNAFRYVCFFIFILFLPSLNLASKQIALPDNSYTLSADLGVGNPTKLGSSTQFQLGYSTFIYNPKNSYEWPFYGGIAIDKNIIKNAYYLFQLGLSYHYFSPMSVNGNLKQGITPPYYQANYTYSINSSQFLAEAILRQAWYQALSPYFILGLGVAFNYAQNYSTNVPAYLTVTPSYSNNTTKSFSYALGLGLDYLIDPKLSIGIAYRFINLGFAGLGSGKIRYTSVSDKLNQSNLYINTLAVQLNYFI